MSTTPSNSEAPAKLAGNIEAAIAGIAGIVETGELSDQEAASLLLRSLRHWCNQKGVDYFEALRTAEESFLRDIGL